MRGDRDDRTMMHKLSVPTLYWQAILGCNFGHASTQWMCVSVCDSAVACQALRRDNVLAKRCDCPPFRSPPFKPA